MIVTTQTKASRELFTDVTSSDRYLLIEMFTNMVKNINEDQFKSLKEKLQYRIIDETEPRYREVVSNFNLTFAQRIETIQRENLDEVIHEIKIDL